MHEPVRLTPASFEELLAELPATMDQSPRTLERHELDGAVLAALYEPAADVGPGWRRLRSTGELFYSARWL